MRSNLAASFEHFGSTQNHVKAKVLADDAKASTALHPSKTLNEILATL